MKENLDEAKRELEREYLLQHKLDEKNRKDNWLYQGLKGTKEAEEPDEDIGSSKTSDRLWSSDETTFKSHQAEPTIDVISDEDESVFDVLARKFETGEITSEEYERMIEEALEAE